MIPEIFKLRPIFPFLSLLVFLTSCNPSGKFFSMRIPHTNSSSKTIPAEKYSPDTISFSSPIKYIEDIPEATPTVRQIEPEMSGQKNQDLQPGTFKSTKHVFPSKVQQKIVDHPHHKVESEKNQTLRLILVILLLILILALFALSTYYIGTLIFSLNTYLILQSLLFLVAVWINVFIALYLLYLWKKLLPK